VAIQEHVAFAQRAREPQRQDSHMIGVPIKSNVHTSSINQPTQRRS
jgi:hypothetical protein